MTTVNTSDEKILKEDLVKDIYFEGDSVKVFKTIAKLTNLGRTYFVHQKELAEKKKMADDFMTNEFGADMYGQLIKCEVSTLINLKNVSEAAEVSMDGFNKARKALIEFADKRDDGWKKEAKWEEVKKLLDSIKEQGGSSGKENAAAWASLQKIFGRTELWKNAQQQKLAAKLAEGWKSWGGTPDGQPGNKAKTGGGLDETSERPCPEQAMRITITTNFDDKWYTSNFKSGLLNKAIMAIKTDARSHISPDAKARDPMADHKYTQDEMLPQDQRRLDSIKWKMTNKVTREFITNFLGWSRKKEKKQGEDGNEFPASDLKPDKTFGKKLADIALSNRGILGRLGQKLLQGGEAKNQSQSISVAFQMADMNDGWKLIKEKGNGAGAWKVGKKK